MGDNPLDDFEDIIPEWDEPADDAFDSDQSDVRPGENVTPLHAVDDPLDSSAVGAVEAVVSEMIVALQAAKTVPLSRNVLVDRDAMVANLQRIASGLPEELRQARWMIREREAFVARTNEGGAEITQRAQDRAKQIIAQAQKRSEELVSQSHVLKEAVEEANVLIRNAEAEARRIRLDAEDYSEERLVHLENLFSSLLHQAREARAEFHDPRPASPEPPV